MHTLIIQSLISEKQLFLLNRNTIEFNALAGNELHLFAIQIKQYNYRLVPECICLNFVTANDLRYLGILVIRLHVHISGYCPISKQSLSLIHYELMPNCGATNSAVNFSTIDGC